MKKYIDWKSLLFAHYFVLLLFADEIQFGSLPPVSWHHATKCLSAGVHL